MEGVVIGGGTVLKARADATGSQMLAIAAIVVMVVLSIVVLLTLLMMTKEAFLREETTVEKIYSREESEKLGLRKSKDWQPPKIAMLLFRSNLRRISKDSTEKALPSLVHNDIIIA